MSALLKKGHLRDFVPEILQLHGIRALGLGYEGFRQLRDLGVEGLRRWGVGVQAPKGLDHGDLKLWGCQKDYEAVCAVLAVSDVLALPCSLAAAKKPS